MEVLCNSVYETHNIVIGDNLNELDSFLGYWEASEWSQVSKLFLINKLNFKQVCHWILFYFYFYSFFYLIDVTNIDVNKLRQQFLNIQGGHIIITDQNVTNE